MNFRVFFDRGISPMNLYYEAETREAALERAREDASALCAEGLDTVVVAVFDDTDEEYYN